MKRKLAALVGAVLLIGSLTGCGLNTNTSLPFTVGSGSIQPVPELDGVDITVGSKEFTENIILGYIAQLALSAAGANVRDMTNIQGSNSARQALEAGQIDLYWEYTGTAWINYQGNTDPIPDERQQYEATKAADEQQQGITWLDYSPDNNTYAFAVREAYGAQHDLHSISDLTEFLRQHPDQAVFCLETEFASRQDGFPGAQRTYGFPVTDTKTFGTGAVYAALGGGGCPIGEVFRTDGRIAGLNLRVLDDDKRFFPQYNAAVTLHQDYLAQYPQLRPVLEPVGKAMNNEQMIQLGKQVDVDGRNPVDVARDWMVSKGFIAPSG